MHRPSHARLWRIAGNQRTVDGADRNADPVGMEIGLGRCLIDPGLIRTERITALEEERDALERRSRPHLIARSRDAGEGRRGGTPAALARRQSFVGATSTAGARGE
jgi:hypothetical protein